MKKIFADTAGWGHLIDSTQKYHELAASIYKDSKRKGYRFITSNYIVSELVALMISPLHLQHSFAVEFINSMKLSSHVEIIHIDQLLDEQAWILFSRRRDKQWSLVDCSSFVIMQKYGITECFTTDKHFEQAGFIRLLK